MNANDDDRAKRLDEYIDALNAGRPALEIDNDAELADLFATARDLHRLRAAEPARDDVPSSLAAALESELRAGQTRDTRRIESNDMSLLRDASSNGSLRQPDDTGNTYVMSQRPERARQWAQFAVAAVAFIVIGVVLAQIIGGGAGEPNSTFGTNTGSTPTSEVDASNDVVSTPAILTPTVTVPSVPPTSANGTLSAGPTATHDLPAVVPTDHGSSPTVEPTLETTPTGETQPSIEPDYATVWLSSDYVTCEDDVILSGSGFEPDTTVVVYGGPLLGDNFGPVSDDIPVSANGSFESSLDVSRVFAQCGGADIDQEGAKYILGAETGSTSTKQDFGGPSARTVITLSSTVPDEVKPRSPLPMCGVEVQRNETLLGPATGADAEMRQCFINAVDQGARAEFVSHRQTIEGDLVTTIYRSLGDGIVEEIVDSTGARFGGGGWTMTTCSGASLAGENEGFLIQLVGCGEPVMLE